MPLNVEKRFVLGVRNDDYPASLGLRKVYRVIPGPDAERRDLFRVIDESGEDYLYPGKFFVLVAVQDTPNTCLPDEAEDDKSTNT